MGVPHIDEIVAAKGIKRSRFIKLVLGLICFNALLVFLYKKRLNQEIKSEMKQQVSSAVS